MYPFITLPATSSQDQTEVESMNKMTKILISTALIFLSPLALACDYPAPPKELPDGTSASRADMLAGVKMISVYQDNMSLYLSCIESDEIVATQALADDDKDGRKQRKEMFDKKYNAAVDEQSKTVEQFNAEIREFKGRSK